MKKKTICSLLIASLLVSGCGNNQSAPAETTAVTTVEATVISTTENAEIDEMLADSTDEEVISREEAHEVDYEAEPTSEGFRINEDLISELGMTYQQLVEKNGEAKGAYNVYGFENGYGRYGWKSYDGEYFENMETAGGCNMIDGIDMGELFFGLTYPISFDELVSKYGFNIVSVNSEVTMDERYWAELTYPEYDNISFIFATTEYGFIDTDTSACIVMNIDCLQANSSAVDMDRTERFEKYNAEEPVVLFESILRNGNIKYDCTVYIYNLLSETNDTYKGNCAVEISDNGNIIDRNMLLVGYTLGQKGTEFSKSRDDGYFSVIELESGSILLSARETGGVTQATLYTVSGNRIVQLERYFENPADKPEKGSVIRSFNLSHSYITDSDSIIFDINGENVRTTVDFDELTLRCDEKYESLVYCE